MISKENLESLAQQVKKVTLIKGGYRENEFYHAIIYADGSLGAQCSVGSRGCYETEEYEVLFEDLEKSEDALFEEHQIQIEENKRKAIEARELAEKKSVEEKEKYDLEEFKRLTEKFSK